VCVCVCVCIHTHTDVYNVYTYIRIYIYIYTYIYVYIYVYIYIYIYTYIHTYIHTYIYIPRRRASNGPQRGKRKTSLSSANTRTRRREVAKSFNTPNAPSSAAPSKYSTLMLRNHVSITCLCVCVCCVCVCVRARAGACVCVCACVCACVCVYTYIYPTLTLNAGPRRASERTQRQMWHTPCSPRPAAHAGRVPARG